MATPNLTIGEVLPSDKKTSYSQSVLNTSMNDALDIAKYDMPGSSDLSDSDIKSIKQIYRDYETQGGDGADSDSAYWNKSSSDNQAYWSKSGEKPQASY